MRTKNKQNILRKRQTKSDVWNVFISKTVNLTVFNTNIVQQPNLCFNQKTFYRCNNSFRTRDLSVFFFSYLCIYFMYYLFRFCLKRRNFYTDGPLVKPFLPISNTWHSFNYMSRYSVAEWFYYLQKNYKTRAMPQYLVNNCKKKMFMKIVEIIH